MIEKIKSELKSEFENKLFDACLQNLEDTENSLRLNNFAYAMRELTRHILKRLAPDDCVLQCSWYKNETPNENGITRKQRSYYAVQGGLTDSYINDTLDLDVKAIHKKLNDAINKLSKYTHIESKSFDLPNEEVDTFVTETIEAVFNFLILIDECREMIISNLWEQIQNTTIDEVLLDTIQEIDVLCSHHFIDEVYTDNIKIHEINNKNVIFHASGIIGSEMQWGSNSDLRRDIGHVGRETFSFTCSLFSPVEDPNMVEVTEHSLVVATEEYLYGRYGRDEHA